MFESARARVCDVERKNKQIIIIHKWNSTIENFDQSRFDIYQFAVGYKWDLSRAFDNTVILHVNRQSYKIRGSGFTIDFQCVIVTI